jgi:hypothetical protein
MASLQKKVDRDELDALLAAQRAEMDRMRAEYAAWMVDLFCM